MRDNRVVMGALILTLLAGAAIGAWLVLQDEDSRGGATVAIEPDDRRDNRDDDTAALTGADTRSNSATPAEESDETPRRDDDPGAEEARPDAEETVNADADATPDTPEHDAKWKESTREFVINGRVTFKSDGRAAVGAAVRAEVVTAFDFEYWRGDGDPMPAHPDRPEAQVRGKTTTNGAGEFRLALTITGFATQDELANDKNAGLSLRLRAVASLSGYAAARSEVIRVNHQPEDVRVELELAVATALKGRVVDARTREGIANATITLWSGDASSQRTLNSDEDGYFSVDDLPEGNWGATVSASGYGTWNGWQQVGMLQLEGGAERDLGEIDMQPVASVAGRVVDEETGKAIPGANVSLQGNMFTGTGFNSTQTDEEGRFSMDSVEPGTYELRAKAKNYAPTVQEDVRVAAAEKVDVGDVKLGRGITAKGTVRDKAGNPVAGAVVEFLIVESSGFMEDEESLADTTTGPDGAYEIGGLIEDKLTLQVRAAGFALYREWVEVEGDGGRFDVALSRGGSIIGRALDAEARPISGASCTAVDHDSREYRFYRMNPDMLSLALTGEGTGTGSDGRFEVSNLPDGTYLVVVLPGGGDPRIERDDVTVRDGEVTDLGDLRIEPPGKVQVLVTEGGNPVPDLRVSLGRSAISFGGSDGLEATTDARGVAVVDDVPPGRWVVRTRRDEPAFDTDSHGREVTAVSGRTVEFHLELQPEDRAHLHGRLTMNGEAVLNDVSLVGRGERQGLFKNTTAQDGRYEFLAVRPGSYYLYARESQTSVAARLEIEIESPGKLEISRDLRGYRVAGRVNTPEGTAEELSSATINVSPVNADESGIDRMMTARAQVQSDGSFEILRVPVGSYVVTATLPGVGTASTAIAVVSGDVAGLSLTVRNDSGGIKVTIGDLNGEAVSGSNFGMVELTDDQGKPVSLGNQQEGFLMVSEGASVTLSTISQGRYSLRVAASGFLPVTKKDIVVETGETTEVSVDLTAGAELHLTVTNGEVTQELLDDATVRHFDAGGREIKVESSLFDAFTSGADTPETPTLIAAYLHDQVAEVRIKVDGYLELTIPVQPQPGQKIKKQETLLAE